MITAIVGRIMLVEQWKEYPTRDGKIQYTSVLVKDNAEVLYHVEIRIQADVPDPKVAIGNSIEMVVYIYSDAFEGRYYNRIKCMRYYIINYMLIHSESKSPKMSVVDDNYQRGVTKKKGKDRNIDNGVITGIAPNSKNNHLDDIPF